MAAFAVRAEIWKLFGSVAAIVLLNFYLGFNIPNIDNWGHFGGLLGGFIIGYFLLTPKIKDPEPVKYVPEQFDLENDKVLES